MDSEAGGDVQEVLLDLTRYRGLTAARVVEAARVAADNNDTVDIIYGLIAPARLEEERVARKRKRRAKGPSATDSSTPRVASAFLVLPATQSRGPPVISVKRLLELETCAASLGTTAEQSTESVYLSLVDGSHIRPPSYYRLAPCSPPRLPVE